jgi:hypothetical protein
VRMLNVANSIEVNVIATSLGPYLDKAVSIHTYFGRSEFSRIHAASLI